MSYIAVHLPCVATPSEMIEFATLFVTLKSLAMPTALRSALFWVLTRPGSSGLVAASSNAVTKDFSSVGSALPVFTSWPVRLSVALPVGPARSRLCCVAVIREAGRAKACAETRGVRPLSGVRTT